MAPDYRSDRSETPEGKGRARAAWDAYERTVNKAARPLTEPALRNYTASQNVELIGFWLAWHLNGGFEGMVDFGMHPSTVWRKVNKFRTAYGKHPDEFELAGVDIDIKAYWDDARERTMEKYGSLPEKLQRKPTNLREAED